MRLQKVIVGVITTALAITTQSFGINYAYSAVLSVPGNIVVRTSTNAEYAKASLTISWDFVAGATAYAVMATKAGSTLFYSVAVPGEKNTQAVISDLIGGASYVVQVRTIQDSDVSAWSSNSLVATPTTLPKAVEKPVAVPGIGSAMVTWTQLAGNENGGSPVTSYVVTESNSGKSISVAPTESSVEVIGLDEGAAAVFRVQALTNVSATGSTSLASDEVTTLTTGSVTSEPTPTASPNVMPTSPVDLPTAQPTSNSSSGSSSSSSGNVVFGGGGMAPPPAPVPSPPATTSPSPAPTPTPSNSVPAENTPLQPIATVSRTATPVISPSPTPSKTPSAAAFLSTATSSKNLQVVSLKSLGSKVSIKESKNMSLVLPVQRAGTKIVVKVKAPNGAVFTFPTITTKTYGSVKVPPIDFKKLGQYLMTITIAGKTSTLMVSVTK